MKAADRAHVSLPEFMSWPLAWRELYRFALIAEQQAAGEIEIRRARQANAARRGVR